MESLLARQVVQASSSHVIHVGNFHLRSECEQAVRERHAAVIGAPSDHAAAFYCVRACDQRVVMSSPPPG